MEGCAALGVNVRKRGVCVIVDNEVGGFFGFVVNMLCSVPVLFFPNVAKTCVHPCARLEQNSELKNWKLPS